MGIDWLVFSLLIAYVAGVRNEKLQENFNHIDEFNNFKQGIVDQVINLYSKKRSLRNYEGVSEAKITCEKCTTENCYDKAKFYAQNMDENINPCEDFYQFACGNFTENAEIPEGKLKQSTFSLTTEKIKSRIFDLLENDSNSLELNSYKNMKTYYQNCMSETKNNFTSANYFKEQIKSFGGWPVLVGDKWDNTSFDWKDTIYKLRKHGFKIGFPIKVKMTVAPLIQPPSINQYLQIASSMRTPLQREKVVKVYYRKMVTLTSMLGADVKMAAEDMIESLLFELRIMKLLQDLESQGDSNIIVLSINELQMFYPSIKWNSILNSLFNPFDEHFDGKTKVIIKDPEFIIRMINLLKKTPNRVIANYIYWSAFFESIFSMSDAFLHTVTTVERRTLCQDYIMQKFQIAVGSLYVKRFFDLDSRRTAVQLITKIKNKFPEKVENGNYSSEIKNYVRELYDDMDLTVGFPENLLNDKEIEDYYTNLEITPGNFLETSLNVSIHKTIKEATYLNPKDWTANANFITTPNAAYNLVFKSVEISTSLLENPFYSVNNPGFMNYAGMGFVIGHEFSHALYTNPKILRQEVKRFECLVEQYSHYYDNILSGIEQAAETVHENIADNSGLRAAYYSYLDWLKQHNYKDKCLPNLDYTPQQMFWIAASNVFCSKTRKQYENHKDEHSSDRIRINGAFSNFNEFSKDFQCKSGTTMNPENKCYIP